MTPTLHMSVDRLTGSKATTSGAMNSGVPCNTFTGVSAAEERMQEVSWDLPGMGVWDRGHTNTSQVELPPSKADCRSRCSPRASLCAKHPQVPQQLDWGHTAFPRASWGCQDLVWCPRGQILSLRQ